MMGKPNTLEEQEEQKKREAESFFAQKDSGTNREQSEVTPPTPPKKPGFWDWLAGVFGYETQTTKNWKQYTEKLASYQETVRRQEEEPAAERAAKEREESEDLEDFLKDEPSAEKQKDGPDLSDVDIKKSVLLGKDGEEVIHATIREAEQSGPDLSDVDIKKGIIVDKDGEVMMTRSPPGRPLLRWTRSAPSWRRRSARRRSMWTMPALPRRKKRRASGRRR